jgi:large subunit ribosomal protein L11
VKTQKTKEKIITKMMIKLLAEGGAMKPGPALSQKLGPAGIPINQVIQKINEATEDFHGLKVPVELNIDVKTKKFEVKIFSPPVSELLKKELGVAKGSGMQLKTIIANASIEQIISVAKTKMQNLLCKDMKSAVKVVVGTCVSLGVLVENKPAKETEKDITAGKYDKEIAQIKTVTSPEKKKALDDYFKEVLKKQELILKQEQAAKEAAEQAATAAAPAAATATPAATAAAPAAAKAAPAAAKAKEPAKKK